MTADLLTQLGDICTFAAVTMLAGAIAYAMLDVRRTAREWRTTDSAIERIGRQGKLGVRERITGGEIAQRRTERSRLLATCLAGCEATQICTVCGRRKKPLGRDSRDNGLCDRDCPGYYNDPRPGHLWPGELEEARERSR